MAAPTGFLTLDGLRSDRFVMVAGGVGITPMLSMLKTLADRGDTRPVLLVVAGRTADDLRSELLETCRKLIRREKSRLARLHADRERPAVQAEFLAERDRLLHALPDAQNAWTVIRYQTMLNRIRDKAVAELDRLKFWGRDE